MAFTMRFPLFVPADRPERFSKAANSGADAVILDLEDAVAENNKSRARENLADLPSLTVPIVVRINGLDSDYVAADRNTIKAAMPAAVMLAKSEDPAAILEFAKALDRDCSFIALIESGKGIANVREIAALDCVSQLAFGSIDYALDLGSDESQQSLLMARSELVLASRLAQLHPPLDGVTPDIGSDETLQDDCQHAKALGFAGKLLIHPRQVDGAKQGFMPSERDVLWARGILSAAQNTTDGVIKAGDIMIDKPVLGRAEQILQDVGR